MKPDAAPPPAEPAFVISLRATTISRKLLRAGSNNGWRNPGALGQRSASTRARRFAHLASSPGSPARAQASSPRKAARSSCSRWIGRVSRARSRSASPLASVGSAVCSTSTSSSRLRSASRWISSERPSALSVRRSNWCARRSKRASVRGSVGRGNDVGMGRSPKAIIARFLCADCVPLAPN